MEYIVILLAALAGFWLGHRLPRCARPSPWRPPPHNDARQEFGPGAEAPVERPGRIYLRTPP